MTLKAEHRKYLNDRGLTDETIKRFNLSTEGVSIAIPVDGATRLYTPDGNPKVRWAKSLEGRLASPFPTWEDLRSAELIVEGEFDCMLAIQLGFNAVSGTLGSNTFLEEWADALGGGVTILYDNDDAGRKGADRAANIIAARGQAVRIARYPQSKGRGYDITDLVLDEGELAKDAIRELLESAVPFRSAPTGLLQLGEIEADLDTSLPLPTGIRGLDEIVTGLRRQELFVVAARPKVGKSTVALQVLTHAAKSGKRVALFSLEMSDQQLLERLIAAEASIPKRNLEKGLADEDVTALYRELPRIWRLPLLMDTQARLTTKTIRERALKAADDLGPIDILAIDYLQLVDTSEKNETRARQLSAAMEDLKSLSKELDCSLVVMSQINREGAKDEGEEPQLHQLMESGGIEANADVVVILWRKRKEEKEAIEHKRDMPTHARVAKNRNGPEDYFKLWLDGPKCNFYEEVL